MTIQEALERVTSKHKLLVQQRQVFFNTYDHEERDEWAKQGAAVLPWYSDRDLAYYERMGRSNPQGWEIRLLNAVDPVWIDDGEGNEIDVTRETLLREARALIHRAA